MTLNAVRITLVPYHKFWVVRMRIPALIAHDVPRNWVPWRKESLQPRCFDNNVLTHKEVVCAKRGAPNDIPIFKFFPLNGVRRNQCRVVVFHRSSMGLNDRPQQ